MYSSMSDFKAYQRTNVETASQGKLIVMLFSRAVQCVEEAKRGLEPLDVMRVHKALIKAQDIVAELRASLNIEAGGDIARNLDRTYEYIHHRLITANIKKEVDAMDECIDHLVGFRDTWQEVFRNTEAGKADAPPPAPKFNQHGHSVMNLEG